MSNGSLLGNEKITSEVTKNVCVRDHKCHLWNWHELFSYAQESSIALHLLERRI